MKAIIHYEPPTPNDLDALKNDLRQTGRGMATLAGLGGDNQWRKYTGGQQPRNLGIQLAFFIAARLELTDQELDRVYNRMRLMGCGLEFEPSSNEY